MLVASAGCARLFYSQLYDGYRRMSIDKSMVKSRGSLPSRLRADSFHTPIDLTLQVLPSELHQQRPHNACIRTVMMSVKNTSEHRAQNIVFEYQSAGSC